MGSPEDDLVSIDRRAVRTMVLWIIGSALYAFAAASALAYALNVGLVSRAWIAAHPALVICGLFLGPMLPAMAVMIIYLRRINAAVAPARGRLVDVREKRGRLAIKLFLFVVPVDAILTTWMDIDKGGQYRQFGDFWYPLNLTLFSLLAVWMLLKQPDTSDEWSRALRSRAARTGFVAAVIGACAIYCLSLVDAGWARIAAPGTIAAAVELALLHYLIAYWWAGREK